MLFEFATKCSLHSQIAEPETAQVRTPSTGT